MVGLDARAPVAEVAERLADALAAHGSVAMLTEGTLATIDQAERDAERVLLRCGEGATGPWDDLCMREAHLVLAVSTGSPSREWRSNTAALQGCELLIYGAAAPDAILAELQPREAQVVASRAARGAAIEALARRLAGRSLGLVLSGGGARALAHLGVLRELHSAGLHFDRVAG